MAQLVITNPDSPWGRAGLHTGDRIVSVNGAPARRWLEFRSVLQRLRVGDTTRMEVERAGKRLTVNVVAAQLTRPVARIEHLTAVTPAVVRLRDAWKAGR